MSRKPLEPENWPEDLAIRVELDALNARVVALQALRAERIRALHSQGVAGRQLSLIFNLTEGRIYAILQLSKRAREGTFGGEEAVIDLDEAGEFVSAIVITHDEDGEYVREG